jgi:hypothetical protein
MAKKYKIHNSAQSSTRGSGKGLVEVFVGLSSVVSHLTSSAKRPLKSPYKKPYKPHYAILSTIMFREKTVCVYEHNESESYSPVTIPTTLPHLLIRDQQRPNYI